MGRSIPGGTNEGGAVGAGATRATPENNPKWSTVGLGGAARLTRQRTDRGPKSDERQNVRDLTVRWNSQNAPADRASALRKLHLRLYKTGSNNGILCMPGTVTKPRSVIRIWGITDSGIRLNPM